MKCKDCGEEFHYCTTCSPEVSSDYGYCYPCFEKNIPELLEEEDEPLLFEAAEVIRDLRASVIFWRENQ